MKNTILNLRGSGPYSWRAIESVLHRWAESNPNGALVVSVGNVTTKLKGDATISSRANGKLSYESVTLLRCVKRKLDQGTEFDEDRIYLVEVTAQVTNERISAVTQDGDVIEVTRQ